jgi:hypothetical protein
MLCEIEVFTAVKIEMMVLSPEDGDSIFLRNAGSYLLVYTASKPRRAS